jgi:hypothetical protein
MELPTDSSSRKVRACFYFFRLSQRQDLTLTQSSDVLMGPMQALFEDQLPGLIASRKQTGFYMSDRRRDECLASLVLPPASTIH